MPLGTEVKLHKVFGKLIIWVIPNIQMFEVVWKTQDSQQHERRWKTVPWHPIHSSGMPMASLWHPRGVSVEPDSTPPWHPHGTP